MADAIRIEGSRWLRRHGLDGAVEVSLTPEGLALGGAGGRMTVPPQDIVRLRAGVRDTGRYGPLFETRIWLRGGEAPLRLLARADELAAYRAVVGGLAARLDVARLECGLSAASRRWAVGLMVLPVLLGLVVAAVPLRAEPLWQKAVVLAVPLAVLALVLRATRSWQPRPARDLADFTACLTRG